MASPSSVAAARLGASAVDRRALLLAAADRVVQRDGPDASMNVIAAEAGITKPILYRHFGDKGGLYRALAQRHIEELLERLRAALVTRGFAANWKARRRYPRELTRPIPFAVEFGIPFLREGGDGIAPDALEWSARVAGSDRASLEAFGAWTPGGAAPSSAWTPAIIRRTGRIAASSMLG